MAAQGIAQAQWQAWFARIAARKSVLLFDTCEAGTLARADETSALERGAANDRLGAATGRTILTASAGDKDAIEGFQHHGLFTYSLLEALERADGNSDGRIDVAELATYVYTEVTTLSQSKFEVQQVPQVRIAANYPPAAPARVLPPDAPAFEVPERPTSRVATTADLFVRNPLGAGRVRRLEANTPMTLVRREAGWALVASHGRPLGYVAMHDLAPLQ